MKTNCPNCKFSFEAEDYLKNKISGPISLLGVLFNRSPKLNPFAEMDESIKIVCPKCKYEFVYKEYKFFGLFGREALHWGYLFFLIIFLCAGGFLLFIKPMQ